MNQSIYAISIIKIAIIYHMILPILILLTVTNKCNAVIGSVMDSYRVDTGYFHSNAATIGSSKGLLFLEYKTLTAL